MRASYSWLGLIGSLAVLACAAGPRIAAAAADDDAVEMVVGSPPMFSDDTGTPDKGGIELNVIVSGEWESDSRSYELPSIDVNVGAGETVQLTFQLPYSIEQFDVPQPGGGERRVTTSGTGRFEKGVKWRFYDHDGLAFAIFPKLVARTSHDFEGPSSSIVLPLLMTREYERWAMTANLGVEKPHGESAEWFASFGAGTRLGHKTALLAEVVGTGVQDADQRRVAVNLGLRRQLDASHVFAVALGRDVSVPDGESHATSLTATVQWLFEP
jgi:hypothetical protein